MHGQEKVAPLDELAKRLDDLYAGLGVNRPFSTRLLRQEIIQMKTLVDEAKGTKSPPPPPPPPQPARGDTPAIVRPKGEKA